MQEYHISWIIDALIKEKLLDPLKRQEARHAIKRYWRYMIAIVYTDQDIISLAKDL